MRFLGASDHKRMRWKNGGGETTEIAVQPPGADLGGFHWRVSVANVSTDGPFSLFPGMDRTLALLSGEGMELSVEGHGRHVLTTQSPPLAFPADAPTSAYLPGGPITDLNAMTRRGAFVHRMKRLDDGPTEARGRWIVLVAAESCSLAVNGEAMRFQTLDALLLDEPARIESDGKIAKVFVVEIDAVS